uniref:Uncharacterized protein n=1 Tax=viral metagenome TaxID=1070528 RepID=A0A6M3IJS0_9ZZZZ
MCEGADRECECCNGVGTFEIIGCPRERLGADMYEALFAAEQADEGMWPCAGGWLDQTRNCIDAVRFIQSDKAHWEIERLGKADG